MSAVGQTSITCLLGGRPCHVYHSNLITKRLRNGLRMSWPVLSQDSKVTQDRADASAGGRDRRDALKQYSAQLGGGQRRAISPTSLLQENPTYGSPPCGRGQHLANMTSDGHYHPMRPVDSWWRSHPWGSLTGCHAPGNRRTFCGARDRCAFTLGGTRWVQLDGLGTTGGSSVSCPVSF